MRTNNGYISFVHQFAHDVLVVCPVCSRQAVVQTNGYLYPSRRDADVRVICPACGFNKLLHRSPTVVVNGLPKATTSGKHLIFGVAIDPFFHLPLWLTDRVQGNLLWAYNHEHLTFLRQFIEAKLRERNGRANTNGSIGSRLPRWMTSRTNREAVLKAINKLMQQ